MIAHAQLVDDDDLGRFAQLGVIPNMQPLCTQLDPLMTELTVPVSAGTYGPAVSDPDPESSGAPLGFGSDWPVSSGSPLEGLAVATSRHFDRRAGRWVDPHEIVPIDRALSAYTAGVAYQAFAGNMLGTNRSGL